MISDTNNPTKSKRGQLLTLGTVSFIAVGFALLTQFVWNMQPCPWCILQRMIFLLLGCAALVGASLRPFAHRPASFVVGLLSISGLGVALYQFFVASKQQSCSFSQAEKFVMWTGLDELFPSLFQVTASCADAALAKLAGIPYELASGALFLALSVWAIQIFRTK
jgi:protein dithiol:quinone oxidoreductase